MKQIVQPQHGFDKAYGHDTHNPTDDKAKQGQGGNSLYHEMWPISVIPLIVFRQGWHYQSQAVNLRIE
jgi:hypothetical protein